MRGVIKLSQRVIIYSFIFSQADITEGRSYPYRPLSNKRIVNWSLFVSYATICRPSFVFRRWGPMSLDYQDPSLGCTS